MTELNKLGVTGLPNFRKGILQSRAAEFSFQKPQHIQKARFYYRKEKGYHTGTRSHEKESVLLCSHKNSELFYP